MTVQLLKDTSILDNEEHDQLSIDTPLARSCSSA